MEDLELIEKDWYEKQKKGYYDNKVVLDVKTCNNILSILENATDDDFQAYIEGEKLKGKEPKSIEEMKAEFRGCAKFYRELLPTLQAEEEKKEQEAKQAAISEQEKKEANRAKNPQYYIANGGGGDCFDYVGYDSNTHKILKAFVDWDSGWGNEMMPDWEKNDIKELPKSCIADFKKVATEWIAKQCGCYFFDGYKGELNIPCKVTTGRKFRGEGTLVRITSKDYIDPWGRNQGYSTAHIIDNDGVEHTAVASRVEFQPGTIEKIVQKAVERMTVGEIQGIFYKMLWHFGKYRYDCYPKIIAKAFEKEEMPCQ